MPGTRSSAATKCISEVPGLQKQVSTPLFSRVWTRLSAPFMGGSFRCRETAGTCAREGRLATASGWFDTGETTPVTASNAENSHGDDSAERRIAPRRTGCAYRVHKPWAEGRLIITAHSAFFRTPRQVMGWPRESCRNGQGDRLRAVRCRQVPAMREAPVGQLWTRDCHTPAR